MIHLADNTTSNIISKSISIGKGRSTYRGQVHMPKHLKNCKNNTECDALLINTNSRTDTYPAITTRGFGEADSVELAGWMCDVLEALEQGNADAAIAEVKAKVLDICARFPVYR
jgi:glycine/serine hydroxymethyltransferase